MGSRHRSREAALKILYQSDLLKEHNLKKIADDLWRDEDAPKADKGFTDRLALGVVEHLEQIDTKLDEAMENWEPSRLGFMERAILRIGAYEILFDNDSPDKVIIDEAIELAKAYCDPKSEGFINGALDRVMKDNQKPADPLP